MKLYLDANVIIYAYEADVALQQSVLKRLFEWSTVAKGELVTSMFSWLECRAIPLRNDDQALLADYDDFFSGDAVELVDVSRAVIELATDLRAAHGFKSPDAIHLATAMHIGATRFMTADLALRRCPGIQIEVVTVPPPSP